MASRASDLLNDVCSTSAAGMRNGFPRERERERFIIDRFIGISRVIDTAIRTLADQAHALSGSKSVAEQLALPAAVGDPSRGKKRSSCSAV